MYVVMSLHTEVFASGDWGNYSECSVTCGNGTRYRTRECIGECKNGTTQYEYEPCDMGCCPGNSYSCQVFAVLEYYQEFIIFF